MARKKNMSLNETTNRKETLMNEKSIDLTDAITPEPETANKITNLAILTATAAVGVFLVVKTVQRLQSKKTVELKVVDNPNA